jgi:hypothetical protein
MASPIQILFAKVAIAIAVGVALATLKQIRQRHGTFWPPERGPRFGVVMSAVVLLLALPAYLIVSQYGGLGR